MTTDEKTQMKLQAQRGDLIRTVMEAIDNQIGGSQLRTHAATVNRVDDSVPEAPCIISTPEQRDRVARAKADIRNRRLEYERLAALEERVPDEVAIPPNIIGGGPQGGRS